MVRVEVIVWVQASSGGPTLGDVHDGYNVERVSFAIGEPCVKAGLKRRERCPAGYDLNEGDIGSIAPPEVDRFERLN